MPPGWLSQQHCCSGSRSLFLGAQLQLTQLGHIPLRANHCVHGKRHVQISVGPGHPILISKTDTGGRESLQKKTRSFLAREGDWKLSDLTHHLSAVRLTYITKKQWTVVKTYRVPTKVSTSPPDQAVPFHLFLSPFYR